MRLDIRKQVFMERVVKPENRLARARVESQPLGGFKSRVEVALGDAVVVALAVLKE